MRLAVSCASGIHWRRLRFLDPEDYTISWWAEWDKLLAERGHRIHRTTRGEAEASGKFWIATVDSFVYPKPTTHCIVMKGKNLHYDSAEKKRQRAPFNLRANPMLILPLGQDNA